MRRICPNCREPMGSNQMYCSGACRRESEQRDSNNNNDSNDLPVGCIVAFWIVVGLVALWLGILFVVWFFDNFAWVICIILALWFGFKFVRWLLAVWRRSSL